MEGGREGGRSVLVCLGYIFFCFLRIRSCLPSFLSSSMHPSARSFQKLR